MTDTKIVYAVAPVGALAANREEILEKLDELREETAQIAFNGNPAHVAEYGADDDRLGEIERRPDEDALPTLQRMLDRYTPPGCEFGYDDVSGKWGYWPKEGFIDAAELDAFEDTGYVLDQFDLDDDSDIRSNVGGWFHGLSSVAHSPHNWKHHERAGYTPKYLSGGDYSGSLVEKSNYEAISEMLGGTEDEEPDADMKEVAWAALSGGHGSYSIFIFRRQAIPDELYEALKSLHEYPLLDEERHSRMELESRDEAWENSYRSDFKSALEKKTGEVVSLDDVPDEVIDKFFYETAAEANLDWLNEQGDSFYFDIDELVKKIGLDEIRTLLGARMDDYALATLIRNARRVLKILDRPEYREAFEKIDFPTEQTVIIRDVEALHESLDAIADAFEPE